MFLLALACVAQPPLPYNDGGGDFFDAPFPSDERRTASGAPDLAGFPNPYSVGLLDTYLEVAAQLDGFGTASPVHFRFHGAIDTDRLPSPAASALPGASVFLLDVDPTSPERGRRIPIVWDFQEEATIYQPANLLSIVPMMGAPLRPATTYAAIVTTDLARPDPELAAAWRPGHPDHEYWREVQETLAELGVSVDDVAIATRFTTQDPVGEMGAIAWWVRHDMPPPDLAQPLEQVADGPAFDAFDGKVWVPVWQHGERPYATEGGGFAWSDDGRPLVADWDHTAFRLTIPHGRPQPDGGWPVVIYAHGTGGDYTTCCTEQLGLEPAAVLAQAGLAVFSISQPLHGDRATPDTDPELHSFNYLNPTSARANFRQGALDAVWLAHVLAGRQQVFDTPLGPVALDPERVGFMGHSQGGITGAIALPYFGDDLRAAVLSGAGGGMSITLVQRKDIVDIEALVRDLLRFGDDEELDALHPVSGLIQLLVEVTDPLDYAPLWFGEGDWSTTDPVDLLLTEGLHDEQTPPDTTEALAAAGGVPILEPVASASEAHDVLGIDPVAAPLSGNLASRAGPVTAGLAQFPDDDHFAVFDNADAARLYQGLLGSALAGDGAVLGE